MAKIGESESFNPQHVDEPDLKYSGKLDKWPRPGGWKEDWPPIQPYLPSEDLVDAVKVAIYLKRPLLVKGEPGCGKTRLAEAVAFDLYGPAYKQYFESWYVKSSSRARDGLYTYDIVGRLRDAELSKARPGDEKLKARVEDPWAYFHRGPLGRAFEKDKRTVVLIDEIDKADLDFPNDLLLELDERRFYVEELEGQADNEVVANCAPIVIVTSNAEKDLPDAFLRRCVFYYIDFPSGGLDAIIRAHFPTSTEDLRDLVITRFMKFRELEESVQARKKVSTSELIDWFRVISHYPEIQKEIIQDLKFPGVLFKNWEDYGLVAKGLKERQDQDSK